MKNFIHILLATLMTVFFASCTDLNPERSFYSGAPQPKTVQLMGSDEYTINDFFPDGDAEQFIIYPRSGWILKPGEVIVFKSLLLDEKTGNTKTFPPAQTVISNLRSAAEPQAAVNHP